MTPDPAGGIAGRLRRLAAAVPPDDATDGQLLGRFLTDRDEASFALLVRRHGGMVLGVCRRVAGNRDADDAFQAVFVVLVRRAAGLTARATVGDWLYGVALRTALKARQAAARRRAREAAVARPEAEPDRTAARELAEAVGWELARLPARLREAVTLCDLEGRPRHEVAALLGVPEGTLSSRLAHARKALADRLARRGFGPTAVAGLVALVPEGLAEAATRAASAAAGHAAGSVPAAVLALSRRRSPIMTLTQWAAGLTAVAAAVTLALGAVHHPAPPPDQTPPEKPADQKLEDGVYLLLREGSEGREVTLTDGSKAVLGKRLVASVGKGSRLQSQTNDNTRFTFHVNGLGPLPAEVKDAQTALAVDGLVFHLGLPEKLPADGVVNAWCNVYTADVSRALAARYGVESQLRKHPGHRFEVRWVPDKPRYETGDPVTLTMELKNTGTGLLRFTHGGKQRGTRDNQFRFVAQAGYDGKGLPDTGDARNFGGILQNIILKPGEVYKADVELTKWFTFTEPNTYQVTGVFEMPVIDPDGRGPQLWDDLAVGECHIRVVAKKK